MRSEDRFVVPGRSRTEVERRVLAQRAETDADWSVYRLPAISAGGETIGLPASVRLQARGDDVVVEATYELTAWPLSGRRPWFRVAVLDARRLLRQALGAPAEAVDEQATEAVLAGAVAERRRSVVRFGRVQVICSAAALALTFTGLVIGRDESHTAPVHVKTYEYPSDTFEGQLAFVYGIDGAVCNNRHTLYLSHTGESVTCTAGISTYRLTVTAFEPLTFDVIRTD